MPSHLLNLDVCVSYKELPKFKILSVSLDLKNCPSLLPTPPTEQKKDLVHLF